MCDRGLYKDVLALHGTRGRTNSREAQHGRRKVNGADKVVVHRARAPAIRKTDHQRNMDAAVVKELLAAEGP